MRATLLLLALFAQVPYSPIQDGDAHGDPPYLLEDGWEPLLDGRTLAGWRACEASATNDWQAVRAVRYERILGFLPRETNLTPLMRRQQFISFPMVGS